MRWRDALVVPLLAALVVLQLSALPYVRLLPVTPQLALLAVLVWALHRGPEAGAFWGFAAGILTDLFAITPLGVSAVAMMATALLVAVLKRLLPPNRILIPMFLGGVGTFAYLLGSFLLLRLAGYDLPWSAPAAASPLILLHAVLILPAYWAVLALERLAGPRRVELS